MQSIVCEAILARDYTLDGSAVLGREEMSNYLAVLVRLAALDGLDVEESSFVQRAAASLGLQPDLADIAGKFIADPSLSSEEFIGRIRDPGLRLCLLRDSYRLAAADGVFSDAEMRELRVIADCLGIDHHTAAEVRTIALHESRLHREFARMVRAARTWRARPPPGAGGKGLAREAGTGRTRLGWSQRRDGGIRGLEHLLHRLQS
jgi:hypothetical protein